MRPVRQLEIKVGLLVVLGLAGLIALVMSADRLRFERNYQVTAWLKDAGGLRTGSPVSLAGIAVGKVKEIRAEPQRGLIRATLDINDQITLPADVEAQLMTSGIFGDASLAFSSPGRGGTRSLPKDGSAAVEVSPGFFDQASDRARRILAAIDDLLDEPTRQDAKRLLASSADLARHAAAIAARLDANRERIESILARIDRASGSLAEASATAAARIGPIADRAEALLAGLEQRSATVAARAETALTAIEGLARSGQELIAANAAELSALISSLRRAGAHAASLVRALDLGEGVLGQLIVNPELAQDLDRIAVDLSAAARTIADHPSSLVFDRDDDRLQADQAQRNRERMRRTLLEGRLRRSATGAEGR